MEKILIRKGWLKAGEGGKLSGFSHSIGFFLVDRHSEIPDGCELFDGVVIRKITDRRGKEVPILRLKPHEHEFRAQGDRHVCVVCNYSELHQVPCPNTCCVRCGAEAPTQHFYSILVETRVEKNPYRKVEVYECERCRQRQEFTVVQFSVDFSEIRKIIETYLANPNLIPVPPKEVELKVKRHERTEIITHEYIEPHLKYTRDAPFGSYDYWRGSTEGRWVKLPTPKVKTVVTFEELNREEYQRYLEELKRYFEENPQVNTFTLITLAVSDPEVGLELRQIDFAVKTTLYSYPARAGVIRKFLEGDEALRAQLQRLVTAIKKFEVNENEGAAQKIEIET